MAYTAATTAGAPAAPLFLTFHGTGGTEAQFHGFASELMPQAHVTSPRGDVSEHGALRYFRRTGEGVYDMADLAQRTAAMAGFIAGEKARTGATRAIVDAALDFLPPEARVLHDQIETEALGLFDRKVNCPVDFGGGA